MAQRWQRKMAAFALQYVRVFAKGWNAEFIPLGGATAMREAE